MSLVVEWGKSHPCKLSMLDIMYNPGGRKSSVGTALIPIRSGLGLVLNSHFDLKN